MDIKLSSLFFFIGTFFGVAQNDSLSSPFFKSYDEKVTSSLYFIDTSNSFEFLFDSGGQKDHLSLIPNRKAQIGANISYKFIDVSYGFSPQFFEENKDNSDSKLFTISTRFYHKKWMQSITFINQKGFYIEDDVTLFLPRLRTTKIGGTTSYVLMINFRLKPLPIKKNGKPKAQEVLFLILVFIILILISTMEVAANIVMFI